MSPRDEPDPCLTFEPKEFMDRLQLADALLFDTMRPASHIIKLAENAPVNHAALYAGDGDYLHATAHKPTDSAIVRKSLWTRLATGEHRTVTAMRHRSVLAGEIDTAAVIDEALAMQDQGETYALVDLISLVVPTFWRSYHSYFDGKRRIDPEVRRLFNHLTKNLIADIEVAASTRTTLDGDGPLTLTCSEFIYLCFDRCLPDSITIVDPLSRWTEIVTPGPSDATLHAAAEADEFLSFFPPVPPRPAGPGGLYPSVNDMITLLRRSIRSISGLAAVNWQHKKYGAPRPGSPLSDCVTPGDLWASPSFAVAAVLHLPPGPIELRP